MGGVIFHLVTLLSELGKCGCVCVGRSREEADQIFKRVQDTWQSSREPLGGKVRPIEALEVRRSWIWRRRHAGIGAEELCMTLASDDARSSDTRTHKAGFALPLSG